MKSEFEPDTGVNGNHQFTWYIQVYADDYDDAFDEYDDDYDDAFDDYDDNYDNYDHDLCWRMMVISITV